tara:strand:- start:417 stop:926 length:510 start_codon:yes stop_codon:yes gene_type:complete
MWGLIFKAGKYFLTDSSTVAKGARVLSEHTSKKAGQAALKKISAAKKAKADKARKKEAESSSKTRQKEDAKLSKRVKKESLRKRKTAQKDKDKRMAARKRERKGMSDHEKIQLGLLGVGGGTYAALRTAFPDPLSKGERNKGIAEEANKNKGGYVKKYAKGGGVRKVRS